LHRVPFLHPDCIESPSSTLTASASPYSTPTAHLLCPDGHDRWPARLIIVIEEVDEHRGGVVEPEEADEKAEQMRLK
jgi:hypothetical protein